VGRRERLIIGARNAQTAKPQAERTRARSLLTLIDPPRMQVNVTCRTAKETTTRRAPLRRYNEFRPQHLLLACALSLSLLLARKLFIRGAPRGSPFVASRRNSHPDPPAANRTGCFIIERAIERSIESHDARRDAKPRRGSSFQDFLRRAR